MAHQGVETSFELLLCSINASCSVNLPLPSLVSSSLLKMKEDVVPLFSSLAGKHTLATSRTKRDSAIETREMLVNL